MKQLRYVIEAALIHCLYGIFAILPLDTASNLGGFLGRTIGSILAKNRIGLKHLSASFPDNTNEQNLTIMRGVWDNLGRVMAEYPHIQRIATQRVEILNHEIIDNILKNGTAAIFISGHVANWEAFGATAFLQKSIPICLTYRAPNNPYVDHLLQNARCLNKKIQAYPKEKSSARELMKTLKDNGYLGILIDQKFNEGVQASFFSQPAMTNPAFVSLAQKFDVPIIPVQMKRTEGANFQMIAHEPLKQVDENNNPLPVEKVIEQAHMLLEDWIKQNPGQWIWLHRRWKKA